MAAHVTAQAAQLPWRLRSDTSCSRQSLLQFYLSAPFAPLEQALWNLKFASARSVPPCGPTGASCCCLWPLLWSPQVSQNLLRPSGVPAARPEAAYRPCPLNVPLLSAARELPAAVADAKTKKTTVRGGLGKLSGARARLVARGPAASGGTGGSSGVSSQIAYGNIAAVGQFPFMVRESLACL